VFTVSSSPDYIVSTSIIRIVQTSERRSDPPTRPATTAATRSDDLLISERGRHLRERTNNDGYTRPPRRGIVVYTVVRRSIRSGFGNYITTAALYCSYCWFGGRVAGTAARVWFTTSNIAARAPPYTRRNCSLPVRGGGVCSVLSAFYVRFAVTVAAEIYESSGLTRDVADRGSFRLGGSDLRGDRTVRD